MRRAYFELTCFLILVLTLASCSSPKQVAYFRGIDDFSNKIIKKEAQDAKYIIRPNDELSINVSVTINPALALPFNQTGITGVGYLVSEAGEINFPGIGNIYLTGLTKQEAEMLIQEKLSKSIEKPVVNIRILNFKVSVLGAVNTPGAFTITNERVTLPEVLSMAGDLSLQGKSDNILICRETENGKTFHRIDLTSAEVFRSPYYYLQQNDIVYVQTDPEKVKPASARQNLSIAVSAISIVTAVTSLVLLFTK